MRGIIKISAAALGAVLIITLAFFGYHAVRAGSLSPEDIWLSVTGAGDTNQQPVIVPGEEPEFALLPEIRAWVRVEGDHVGVTQQLILSEETSSFTGYLNSMQFAQTSVLGVSSPGGIASYKAGGMTFEVGFTRPSRELTVEYEMTLSHTVEMLSWSENQILLCNFLMTPSVTRDGKMVDIYRSGFGDPYIYESLNYVVEVTADSAYTMLAAGKTGESADGGRSTAVFHGAGIREFSVVLMKDFELASEQLGGTTVYYADAALAQPFVRHAMSFARENIGEYPYRDLFVIAAPIGRNQGMEMSNLILITPESFENLDLLKSLTYHEVLHQWFYLIIGTDQINEPFLDEGMVAFLTTKLCLGETPPTYNPAFMNRAIRDYASADEYRAGAYTQSARYVSSLFERVGEEGFYAALKRMYAEQAGRIMYFDAFRGYFDK